MKRLVSLALLLTTTPLAAQTVPDRIAKSLALRDQWQWLTRDIASPAEWDADGRHFHYRKTVAGGFAFVDVDAATRAKAPAFDAAALALKFSDLSMENTFHAFLTLKGKRLTGSFGSMHGLKIEKAVPDEISKDDLPYMEMIYRFVFGPKSYYNLEITKDVKPQI